MGNKINSLRGREEEELDDNGNVRARSISVGGGGNNNTFRAMSSSMSAPSGSRPLRPQRVRVPGGPDMGFLWGMSSSAPSPNARLTFPSHTLWASNVKCPVCSKKLMGDDVEEHLVLCLSKPRVTYNENVLTADAGECDICMDDMLVGNVIARLQCLCIYHKKCIDQWFDVNRSCPKHPVD